MAVQETERSGSEHRRRLAPFALGGTRWWSAVGVLTLGVASAYLLPGFTDGGHAIDARPIASDDPSNETASPASFLSLVNTWHSLPLLASRDPTSASVDDAVNVLALQAAFERERERANAAELQMAALQEQLVVLREKQEEVTVLREQIADLKAKTPPLTEVRSEAVEEKERADDALLGAALIAAQEAAENERKKASAALEQLKIVQGQLAALMQESEKSTGQQQPGRDQVIPAPSPDHRTEQPPVGPTAQPPCLRKHLRLQQEREGTMRTETSHRRRMNPKQTARRDKTLSDLERKHRRS